MYVKLAVEIVAWSNGSGFFLRLLTEKVEMADHYETSQPNEIAWKGERW